eukprot:TRINITY_DN29825_c0_g1_i4.p1 TRINITY_DN29825_c0_g1~~TRINITY_DN29825_c0_g1_i4.p1  ORF type:complete len:405 (-),score=64.50 TRINITY_DN29825_c0_g1_i4:332-1546(-)
MNEQAWHTEPLCRKIQAFADYTDLLVLRGSCSFMRSSCEAAAAQAVRESRRRVLQLPRDNPGVRWFRALAQVQAPPRLVAAGGYNSEVFDHEPVRQAGDGQACEESAEVVFSLQGDDVKHRWRRKLPKMLERRADLALVAGLDCKLYAVGGRCGESRHNSVEVLDLVQMEIGQQGWAPFFGMSVGRSGLAAGILGDHLIAVGGRTHAGVLRQAEGCSIDGTEGWVPLESMRQPREYAAAAALHAEMWVMGGGEVQGSKTVEVYNIDRNSWTPGPELNLARYGAGAAIHEGRLLVVGGSFRWGARQLTTLEALDPREGIWHMTPFCADKGHTSLWGCSVVSRGDSIFIAGGTYREAEESLDSILRIDLRTMKMSNLASELVNDDAESKECGRLRVARWCGGACFV